MKKLKIHPSKLSGEFFVPGSKSHTIRALLMAALSDGQSVIHNPLPSADGLSAVDTVRAFGSEVTLEDDRWIVDGQGLQVPDQPVDVGNSGTTIFFAIPIAATLDAPVVLTGDEQIQARPVDPLANELQKLGVKVRYLNPGSNCAPIEVRGPVKGGKVKFSGFNSQYISGMMIMAPLTEHGIEIDVDNPFEKPYLQMTIDWLEKFGIEFKEKSPDYKHFVILGGQRYKAFEGTVASDWSGVAFPVVGALITGSEITIPNLDFEDSQGDKAVLDYLESMGAQFEKDYDKHTLKVLPSKLKGGLTISLIDTPDALPALSVAASFAEGTTTFTGLGHVRVKETDRVAVMEEELNKLGAKIETGKDYMTVTGTDLHSGNVSSHGDHRIAMALTMAGLALPEGLILEDPDCASVSYPGFYDILQAAGGQISND